MLASAVHVAATAISALKLAPKADPISLRRALFLTLVGLCFAMAICASALKLRVLITGQALAGLAVGLALPAIYGLAAEIAPKGRESETPGKLYGLDTQPRCRGKPVCRPQRLYALARSLYTLGRCWFLLADRSKTQQQFGPPGPLPKSPHNKVLVSRPASLILRRDRMVSASASSHRLIDYSTSMVREIRARRIRRTILRIRRAFLACAVRRGSSHSVSRGAPQTILD